MTSGKTSVNVLKQVSSQTQIINVDQDEFLSTQRRENLHPQTRKPGRNRTTLKEKNYEINFVNL